MACQLSTVGIDRSAEVTLGREDGAECAAPGAPHRPCEPKRLADPGAVDAGAAMCGLTLGAHAPRHEASTPDKATRARSPAMVALSAVSFK